MYRTALTALATTVLFAATVIAAEPKAVEVTAEVLEKARSLVRQLGSDIFQDRENAALELRKLGRSALPAIAEGTKSSKDAEIRSRCELLILAIEADELNARIEAFVADKDGKLEHDLPGWKEMCRLTDGGPLVRSLFTEMLKTPEIRHVLLGLTLDRKEFSRRADEWTTKIHEMMWPKPVRGVQPPGYDPSRADFVSLLFILNVLADQAPRKEYVLLHPRFRTLLERDKHGPVIKQLLLGWCDSLSNKEGVSDAMRMTSMLDMKEVVGYAEKYLLLPDDLSNAGRRCKAEALCHIAQFGGKDKIPFLEKYFDDKTDIDFGFVIEDCQLRDIALAMALLTAGKKPEDFGYTTSKDANKDVNHFNEYRYRFPSDEARTKAFEKWKAESQPKK